MPVTVQKWAGYISLLARFSTKVEGVCGSVIMGESVTMRGREDGRVCVMVLDAKARLGLLLLRNSADFKSAFVRSFLDVILLKTEAESTVPPPGRRRHRHPLEVEKTKAVFRGPSRPGWNSFSATYFPLAATQPPVPHAPRPRGLLSMPSPYAPKESSHLYCYKLCSPT